MYRERQGVYAGPCEYRGDEYALHAMSNCVDDRVARGMMHMHTPSIQGRYV